MRNSKLAIMYINSMAEKSSLILFFVIKTCNDTMFFTLLKTITRTRLSYFVMSSKEHLA